MQEEVENCDVLDKCVRCKDESFFIKGSNVMWLNILFLNTFELQMKIILSHMYFLKNVQFSSHEQFMLLLNS